MHKTSKQQETRPQMHRHCALKIFRFSVREMNARSLSKPQLIIHSYVNLVYAMLRFHPKFQMMNINSTSLTYILVEIWRWFHECIEWRSMMKRERKKRSAEKERGMYRTVANFQMANKKAKVAELTAHFHSHAQPVHSSNHLDVIWMNWELT